jgi:hypothetical protein
VAAGKNLMQDASFPLTDPGDPLMLGILVAVLAAVLSYLLCVAVGLPSVVGLVAAILMLVALAPSGGYGVDDRHWDGRTRS